MVSVKAQGFLPASIEQEVEAACENPSLPVTIRLGKAADNSTNVTTCENTTMTITVSDLMTGVAVNEAIVNIKLEVSYRSRLEIFVKTGFIPGYSCGCKCEN